MKKLKGHYYDVTTMEQNGENFVGQAKEEESRKDQRPLLIKMKKRQKEKPLIKNLLTKYQIQFIVIPRSQQLLFSKLANI